MYAVSLAYEWALKYWFVFTTVFALIAGLLACKIRLPNIRRSRTRAGNGKAIEYNPIGE